ncbi:uncharacterized protein LOC122571620 isoform X2 [Bombus pyrosoma]|uniref:uncharacterized protein LOC122571620 isoform X2 n=1 Tax=Bombus pyrosoma TaxID=396416 RepID=UPI001CB8E83D|nr:uncharacterized protein LOC122571620 isoform X2 [Bombus pyrosoma]
MSNLDGRKTKSLNNIPEVFKRRDHDESKVLWKVLSKVSLENVASERFKTLNARGEDASPFTVPKLEVIKQSDNDESSNTEDEANEEKGLKKPEVPKLDAEDQIKNTFKLDFSNISLKRQKRILSIIDSSLSLILITPMTISFWRGTWTLMDIYADMFPELFTFLLGILIHTCFAIMRNFLHDRVLDISKRKTFLNKTYCKIIQILYTYVFGISCNMHWRGAWIIFDHFFIYNIWVTVTATLAPMIILAIFRSIRNVIAIPSVINVDILAFVFRFPTRYKLIVYLLTRGDLINW